MSDEPRPIIIKRIKKVSGGAHGGAWKVAYADFVTAMMAFFMLLWLLNVTTDEQKDGLADYFAPTSASTNSESGAGGVLGGISLNTDGAQASAVTVSIPDQQVIKHEKDENSEAEKEKKYEDMMAEQEQESFEALVEDIKSSLQENPELAELRDQVLIDITEEGMRIQIVDKDNRAMFKKGTAELYVYAKKLLAQISISVQKMPNRISITGHTDASPFNGPNGRSNWELSSDRANSSRRTLSDNRVSADRFSEVMGKAATEPLLPDHPLRSENRRITILLIREAPTLPPSMM